MNQMNRAIEILNSGGVVGMPTETVYGLAARIDIPSAVEKIFSTKSRPFFDPLIVHVADTSGLGGLVKDISPLVLALAEHFWPGPLTLVLPKARGVSDLITAGLETVGVRCPAHPIARELIQRVGVPLAAPSANRFGKTSPTTARHVRDEFKDQVFVLDGGACEIGIESTILRVGAESELSILRPGAISIEQISRALEKDFGSLCWVEVTSQFEAPGQMKHHYMPSRPLVVVTQQTSMAELCSALRQQLKNLPEQIEGVQILHPSKIETPLEITLSSDPVLAARELYAKLRDSAKESCDFLWIHWPHQLDDSNWSPIWDRLKKAASLII